MPELIKPTVGQVVYLMSNQRYGRTGTLEPHSVSKVGRKYFTIVPVGGENQKWNQREFYIDSWREFVKGGYSSGVSLYASQQEYADKKERAEIVEQLRKLFTDYRACDPISLMELRAIKAIAIKLNG